MIVEDSRLIYKLSRQIVNTTKSRKGSKWIFVLSTCKTLYIGQVDDYSASMALLHWQIAATSFHLANILGTDEMLVFQHDYRNRRAHSSTPASLQGELHQLQGD